MSKNQGEIKTADESVKKELEGMKIGFKAMEDTVKEEIEEVRSEIRRVKIFIINKFWELDERLDMMAETQKRQHQVVEEARMIMSNQSQRTEEVGVC